MALLIALAQRPDARPAQALGRWAGAPEVAHEWLQAHANVAATDQPAAGALQALRVHAAGLQDDKRFPKL